jgi:hypothetical protein
MCNVSTLEIFAALFLSLIRMCLLSMAGERNRTLIAGGII